MRVLLIGFFTKTYMPYINIYEDILKEKKINYDIIYFDRDSNKKPYNSNNEYIFSTKTTANKFKKIIPVLKYRNYIKKVMKKTKYDKIVVLTTMPGILIYKTLLKKYKGNYIFDYRDYTYEKYGFYKKIVNKIISNSFATFISSEGYKKYFNDQSNIYLTHNISNEKDLELEMQDLNKKDIIRIGFLGYVRYYDVNTKLINDLKNDNKYLLSYIGTVFSDCNLKEFCQKNNIDNVIFQGKYDNSLKSILYKDIDIINSIYSLNSEEVQPAIPNRLYDAVLFKKPIIVAKGSYLSEVVEKYKLGLVVDVFECDLKKEIENYIKHFNSQEFINSCNKFLKDIDNDTKKMKQKIKELILN